MKQLRLSPRWAPYALLAPFLLLFLVFNVATFVPLSASALAIAMPIARAACRRSGRGASVPVRATWPAWRNR